MLQHIAGGKEGKDDVARGLTIEGRRRVSSALVGGGTLEEENALRSSFAGARSTTNHTIESFSLNVLQNCCIHALES